MKTTAFLILAFQLATQLMGQELELLSVGQIQRLNGKRFDLSGISSRNDSVFVVADKASNPYIYLLGTVAKGYEVASWKKIRSAGSYIDYEGIAQAKGEFYLINEKTSSVQRISEEGTIRKTPIRYKDAGLKPKNWKNAGLEGIAINEKKGLIYLAKERSPRFILEVEEETGRIRRKIKLKKHGMDFSDLCFNKGYLYALIRSSFEVLKIDPKNMKVNASYSYRSVAKPEKEKLFEPYRFGMAEALLLTENEIWIGLDNNHVKASGYGSKRFGLEGNAPAILKFRRPVGF